MARITNENEEFLYKEDIKKKLGIKANVAWNARRPGLVKFGMFKTGRIWIMRKTDWDLYIENLANMAKTGPQIIKKNGTAF